MTNRSTAINANRYGVWITTGVVTTMWIASAITYENYLYLGVILAPLLIYVSIRNPFFFPVGLYAFLVPFDQLLSLTDAFGGATFTKLLGILSMLVLLVKGIFEKKLRKPGGAVVWWTLLIAYGALSIFWAIESQLVLGRIPTAVGLLLFYLILSSYKIRKNDLDTIKWCILAGGFFAALATIYNYQALTVATRTTLQWGERSAELNQLSFDLLIPIAICIEKVLAQDKKVMKASFGLVLGIIMFSVIITGSRGGMLGAGTIFIIYILSAQRQNQKVTFALISLVIGITVLSILPDFFVDRWKEAADTGGTGRTSIWRVGLEALREYWISGAGLNNFTAAFKEFAHYTPFSKFWGRAAHNIYLAIFVELGIIGFILLVLGIGSHYRAIVSSFHVSESDKIMLKAALSAMVVSSFFLDTLWYKSLWLLWMMILMHRNVQELEADNFMHYIVNFQQNDIAMNQKR
ncbi:MAG: O-antigen ligase family protein [Nitrospirota bacterium]